MNFTTLQKALNKLGADPQLKLTGISDDQTKTAVVNFQKKNNLKPIDGIVGPITGTAIAQKLNPNGIPVALACVLDCTDWDMPSGGWHMPKNTNIYRFFFQPSFPGGGYGAVAENNERLSCGHCQVPADPNVLAWVTEQALKIRNADPTGKYFALLIRGLTMGDDALSPLEYEQNILKKLNIECQIVSEGTFAHELQGANQAIAFNEALAGKKIMLFGHSMGGDEIVPIAQSLSREYVLNM